MRVKFFLILFVTILIGIQPVFAQSESGVPVKEETVINIYLASDSEFTQALESAGDVELVNE